MSDRVLQAGSIAAAAVVIGGALILVMPQHAANIIRLVIITVAAAVVLYALTENVAEWNEAEWLTSPFNRSGSESDPDGASEEVDRIRATFGQPRQLLEGGTPVTPGARRLLRPLIRTTLERQGVDMDDPKQLESVRERVSPLTWSMLTAPPLGPRRWYRTRRPDEHQVADLVHHVLDDLDRLAEQGDADQTPSPYTKGAP